MYMKADELEQFRKNIDNLFTHLYNMGREVATYNNQSRSIDENLKVSKAELMDELDKSYLDAGWADDVSYKREQLVDLCWNVLSWGWFEGNK